MTDSFAPGTSERLLLQYTFCVALSPETGNSARVVVHATAKNKQQLDQIVNDLNLKSIELLYN